MMICLVLVILVWLIYHISPKKSDSFAAARSADRGDISLKENAENYRILVENIRDVFWLSTPNLDQFFYVSPAYEEIWGKTCESLYAEPRSFLDAIHPEDRDRILAILEHPIQDECYQEYRIVQPNGEIRWLRWRAFPVKNERGEVDRIVGITDDISEQQAALRERKQLEELLRQQAEKLAQANQIKDEFLAVTSHELRTSLTTIVGWSQLLRKGNMDKETALQTLEIIERSAKIQDRIVADLIDISRILCGKIKLKYRSVDLKDLITGAVDIANATAANKAIVIETIYASPVSLFQGDFDRLQQVLLNLLNNAIAFTPPSGKVEVKLEQLQVCDSKLPIEQQPSEFCNLQCHISYAKITISDTGIGISAKFLPHIFEQFRPDDDFNIGSSGEQGLGLAIARQLVEMHGGMIYAESPGESKGATFTVILPLID